MPQSMTKMGFRHGGSALLTFFFVSLKKGTKEEIIVKSVGLGWPHASC